MSRPPPIGPPPSPPGIINGGPITATWDLHWKHQLSYTAPNAEYPESIWYSIPRYITGTEKFAPAGAPTTNTLPPKRTFMWDRPVWLSAVLENGNALVILGPHRSDPRQGQFIIPKWTTADIDWLYRQVNGGVFSGFFSLLDGTGYYERILWAKINNLITVEEIDHSPELKKVVDFHSTNNYDLGYWLAVQVQTATSGQYMAQLNELITKFMNTKIGIVQPDGRIVYNTLERGEVANNPENYPAPPLLGLPEWLVPLLGVVVALSLYNALK